MKEDMSNCPPPREKHTLKVSFGSGRLDVKPDGTDLKTAVIYVFDGSGNLFATWTVQNPELDKAYDTGIELGEVNYRIVTWINSDTPPYTATPARGTAPGTPQSSLTDGKVTLNVPADGNVTDILPMLFYGSAEQVAAPATGDSVLAIPLTQDTYRINVILKGIPQDGGTYRLQISDTNGAYDFNNNFLDTTMFNYVNSATAGGAPGGTATGDLKLSLNTLRLDGARSPMISVVNTTTGKTVFPQNGASSVNLMELIRQTGIDIGQTHNLDIEVPAPSTGDAGTVITVTINGWNVVLGDLDINPHE